MKARIKFLINRIGIDEFRVMVEDELKEEWAQKSFDPTPLLFIEDEEKDAPIQSEDKYSSPEESEEFKHWIATNVQAQKQEFRDVREYSYLHFEIPARFLESENIEGVVKLICLE